MERGIGIDIGIGIEAILNVKTDYRYNNGFHHLTGRGGLRWAKSIDPGMAASAKR
jgi:hypothetical protein